MAVDTFLQPNMAVATFGEHVVAAVVFSAHVDAYAPVTAWDHTTALATGPARTIYIAYHYNLNAWRIPNLNDSHFIANDTGWTGYTYSIQCDRDSDIHLAFLPSGALILIYKRGGTLYAVKNTHYGQDGHWSSEAVCNLPALTGMSEDGRNYNLYSQSALGKDRTALARVQQNDTFGHNDYVIINACQDDDGTKWTDSITALATANYDGIGFVYDNGIWGILTSAYLDGVSFPNCLYTQNLYDWSAAPYAPARLGHVWGLAANRGHIWATLLQETLSPGDPSHYIAPEARSLNKGQRWTAAGENNEYPRYLGDGGRALHGVVATGDLFHWLCADAGNTRPPIHITSEDGFRTLNRASLNIHDFDDFGGLTQVLPVDGGGTHTSNAGNSWKAGAGSTYSHVTTVGTVAAGGAGVLSDSEDFLDYTPANANYAAHCIIVDKGGSPGYAGLTLRRDTTGATQTYYAMVLLQVGATLLAASGPALVLFKSVAGVWTFLNSVTVVVPSGGFALNFSVKGTALYGDMTGLYGLAGVGIGWTDSSISAIGRAGIILNNSQTLGGEKGLQIDSFQVSDAIN